MALQAPPGTDSTVVSLSERALLARHLRGERGAFRELMEAYAGPIYAYLGRTGVPPSEREDLFQEIFVRIHRGAASYQPERPLKPWIFAVAVNTTRSWFRRRRVQELLAEQVPEQPQRPVAQARAEASETAALLSEEIAALPERQREVLVLVCLQQVDQREVARTLEIPLNTVKTRLRRARLALAQALARRDAAITREAR